MIKQLLFAGVLLAVATANVHAQADTTAAPKERATDHYIGVQMNGFIRQVINLNNNSNNAATNPYLLTYSLNSRRTGWGFRVGAGYSYSSLNSTTGSLVSDNDENIINARVGGERLFRLARRWTAGAGLDIVANSEYTHTATRLNSGGTGFSDVKSTTISYGGGPMAWLRFSISERILVGSEASFYAVTGTKQQTATPNSPKPVSTPKTKIGEAKFTSPVTLFLSVKF